MESAKDVSLQDKRCDQSIAQPDFLKYYISGLLLQPVRKLSQFPVWSWGQWRHRWLGLSFQKASRRQGLRGRSHLVAGQDRLHWEGHLQDHQQGRGRAAEEEVCLLPRLHSARPRRHLHEILKQEENGTLLTSWILVRLSPLVTWLWSWATTKLQRLVGFKV